MKTIEKKPSWKRCTMAVWKSAAVASATSARQERTPARRIVRSGVWRPPRVARDSAPVTAPIPSAAMRKPNPSAPSPSTFRATRGTTIAKLKTWRVGMSITFAQPRRSARTATCQYWTCPLQTSAVIVNAWRARADWVARISRRLGSRSTIAPATTENIKTGANWNVPMSPSLSGEPLSCSTSHDWATDCIHVPISETSWPPQKKRKSRWLSARSASGKGIASFPACAVPAAKARWALTMIAPGELARLMQSAAPHAVLDLRERAAYERGHIYRATSLPRRLLEFRLPALVPARATPLVVCDADGRLAALALPTLGEMGYPDVRALDGGLAAWHADGRPLVEGVNVPSKVFGERALHECQSPQLAPHEPRGRSGRGDDLVIVDARTPEEYARGTLPGAWSVPGGELVFRIAELVGHPETTIVVHCSGRTRSYIGAESLRRMRLANPVVALENGTMGWELAGLALERGAARWAPAPSARSRAVATLTAKRVAAEDGIPFVSPDELAARLATRERQNLYVLDVRTADEYAAGHVAGPPGADRRHRCRRRRLDPRRGDARTPRLHRRERPRGRHARMGRGRACRRARPDAARRRARRRRAQTLRAGTRGDGTLPQVGDGSRRRGT